MHTRIYTYPNLSAASPYPACPAQKALSEPQISHRHLESVVIPCITSMLANTPLAHASKKSAELQK